MTNDVLSHVWPEWSIVKQIGKGSHGVVYEVVRKDHQVESRAAVKVISIPQNESEMDSLRSEGLDAETYLQNVVNDFISEIQLMESFKGVQNIVSVEDYKVVKKTDDVGWNIYIRMELLTPFNTYISDNPLSEQDVIKLGCDICRALELCAQRNVIHRDIKPENIFVNPFGHFKLGDFGIARKLENVTGALSQKGTYYYMAPEIERGSHYDATVDLYSLGLVLYRLMNNNRLPFLDTERQALDPNERMSAVRRRLDGEPLPEPCNASKDMAKIILCACSHDPKRRFVSATAMKNALMSIAGQTIEDKLNGTISVRKPPEIVQKKRKPVDTFGEKKTGKALLITVIVLAVIAIIVIAFIYFENKEDDTDANSETTAPTVIEETSEVTVTLEPELSLVPVLTQAPTQQINITNFIGTWSWQNDISAAEFCINSGSNGYPTIEKLEVMENYGTHRVSLISYSILDMTEDSFSFKFVDNYDNTGTMTARYDNIYDCIYLSSDSSGELGSVVAQKPFNRGVLPTQTPTLTTDNIYYSKILPKSATYGYSSSEILERIQIWVEYGYTIPEALRLARNEIFANHGNIFEDSALNQYYYIERSHLYGTWGYQNSDQAYAEFNNYELNNIDAIKELERRYS